MPGKIPQLYGYFSAITPTIVVPANPVRDDFADTPDDLLIGDRVPSYQ